MSEIKLSKEADALICLIYKHYLELRSTGISKSEAKFIGSSINIHTDIIPEWLFEDVDDTCRELGRTGILSIQYADDICNIIYLNDNGIIYMENRFFDKANKVIDKIINYISAIKFW